MDSVLAPRILRTADAARFIGLGVATLEKWRSVGAGPRFVKLGQRSVGYDIRDLEAWLDERRRATEAAPL